MEILLGAIFVFMCVSLIMLFIQNRILRKRISMVESIMVTNTAALGLTNTELASVKADTVLLTKDQEAWLKKNKQDIQKKINTLSEELKAENQKLNSDQEQWITNHRAEFETRLASEFEKACEQINFKGIEYKDTITLKRKQYSRKNASKAKPQREIRYIDEDDTPSMQF